MENKLILLISLIIFIAGVFGMLFCFPYLWSHNIKNSIAAGLPFLAGAVLTGAGLISLCILNKK